MFGASEPPGRESFPSYSRPKALVEKYAPLTGFSVIRQDKHIVMSDGARILTIPRHNPVNAYTMGGIVRDAGVSDEEFRKNL